MEPEHLIELLKRMPPSTAWSSVSATDQFVATPLGHGTMAQVVRCDPGPGLPAAECPRLVVKRVPRAFFIKSEPLELSVVNAVVSQSGVSPPLLYTSQQAQVYQYIEGEHYGQQHDLDPELVARLARLLARLHRLSVPVSNGGSLGWRTMLSAASNMPEAHIFLDRSYLPTMVQRHHPEHAQTVSEIDMVSEMDRLNGRIERLGSPIVFSHNDFNRENRWVAADGARIYLIDLDYANYYYRGYDLGRYFSNFRHRTMFADEGFPAEPDMDLFLVPYIDEWLADQPDQQPDRDSLLRQLRLEGKIFALDAYLLDVYFGLWQYGLDPSGPEASHYLEIVENRWRGYRRLEHQFERDGTLQHACFGQQH